MTQSSQPRVAAVFVKSVPLGGRFLRIEGATLTRSGVPHGLDPINEVSIEWALLQREAGALDEVVAVAMGPEGAATALRRCLALGCDRGVLICDDALVGAGVGMTARALAGATRWLDSTLCLFGNESLDGSSGTIPAAVAALLGWPLVSLARSATMDEGTFRAERDLGSGPEIAQAKAPLVASFVAGGIAPRYPKLKDTLRAKSVEVVRLNAADLGVTDVVASGESSLRLEPLPQAAVQSRVAGLEEGLDELLDMMLSAGAQDG